MEKKKLTWEEAMMRKERCALNLDCSYREFVDWVKQKYPNALLEETGNAFELYLPSDGYIEEIKRILPKVNTKTRIKMLGFFRFEILSSKPLSLEGTLYTIIGTDEPKYSNFIALANNYFGQAVGAAKPRTPNGQINQRAMIWRELKGWIKLGNVPPKPKECIEELKRKPAYKKMTISTKRMQRILDEGFAGTYDDLLKNV